MSSRARLGLTGALAWPILLLAGLLASLAPAAAQLPDQAFEVVPETVRARIGDPVPLRFRVRLDDRDLLYDTVPKAVNLPPGVRILSVEKLQRGPDRIFRGRAQVAFYRPGRQAAPVFGLDFMRGVKGLLRGTLKSDSAFVEIVPVAPAGSPSLKDIKQLALQGRADPLFLVAALAAALGGIAVDVFRRRRKPGRGHSREPAVAASAGRASSPYEMALSRLAELEEGGPAPDGAAYYEAVANVLRDYLHSAADVPARQCTTAELTAVLPAELQGDGLRERCRALFAEADLLKFARARRGPEDAPRFAREARALLDGWNRALPSCAEPRP